MKHWFLADEAQTNAVAAALAQSLPQHACVWLQGDLGAGKSSFARGFIRALGVIGTVRSPTYTLVERYPLADGRECLHLDLYRIGAGSEMDFLGLDEPDPLNSVWLIEWPERAMAAIPAPDLHLSLEISGSGRQLSLVAANGWARQWLEAAAESIELRPVS